MLKPLFTFLLVAVVIDAATAQSSKPFTDTVTYYAKNRQQVATADSAYYVHKILPLDSASKLYPVVEYFMSGKLKLKTYAKNSDGTEMHGNRLEYFENGKRKSVSTFLKGQPVGREYIYYPNGKMYSLKEMATQGWLLIECYDTTGNAVAKNGEGTWLDYDYDVEHFYISGPIVNGKKNGEWSVRVNSDIKYVENYTADNPAPQNKFVNNKGETIDWVEGTVPDATYSGIAKFKKGYSGFGKFLAKNIKYPTKALARNVQGRVYVSFMVSEKGVLKDFKITRGIGSDCDEEVIRVMKLSPDWIPTYVNGKTVSQLYTVPVVFNIGSY